VLLRRRGGQHACLVADALGMTRVFIHPLAGVLSAYGMGLADVRALRQEAVEAALTQQRSRDGRRVRALERRARRGRAQGIAPAHRVPRHAARQVRRHRHDARAARRRDGRADRRGVRAALRQQYGFLMPGKALVIEAIAVEAVGRNESRGSLAPSFAPRAGRSRRSRPIASTRTARSATRTCTTATTLRPGDAIDGPRSCASRTRRR
jgi:5-oxoprolinase (ATP-hydrolysing)